MRSSGPGAAGSRDDEQSSSASSGANEGSASAASASRPRPRACPPDRPGERPHRCQPAARDEERAPEAGLARGREDADAHGAKPFELGEPLDRLLERLEPVAHPGGVLEAEVAREPAEPRAKGGQRVCRVVSLEPVERARRRAAPGSCS